MPFIRRVKFLEPGDRSEEKTNERAGKKDYTLHTDGMHGKSSCHEFCHPALTTGIVASCTQAFMPVCTPVRFTGEPV